MNQLTNQPVNQSTKHTPVLLNEVLEILNPKKGDFIIDGTYGGGGHSDAIRKRIGPEGNLLAIDWEKTGDNFADLPEILQRRDLDRADGLLLDLGFSSEQLDSGRGFSFNRNEPLLMTYSNSEKPVKDILNEVSEKELADIIWKYGEERFSRRIAKAIKENKDPIETSKQLAEIISYAIPKRYGKGRLHPATRTFMALRIYANHELDNLERVLERLDEIVGGGARVAIISFHSLEDRIVKNYFRQYKKEGMLEIITKKPITATEKEVKTNPRARSAKLRGAIIV